MSRSIATPTFVLPEMTFFADGAVPPIVFPPEEFPMKMPSSFGSAVRPSRSVPTLFPSTTVPVAPALMAMPTEGVAGNEVVDDPGPVRRAADQVTPLAFGTARVPSRLVPMKLVRI